MSDQWQEQVPIEGVPVVDRPLLFFVIAFANLLCFIGWAGIALALVPKSPRLAMRTKIAGSLAMLATALSHATIVVMLLSTNTIPHEMVGFLPWLALMDIITGLGLAVFLLGTYLTRGPQDIALDDLEDLQDLEDIDPTENPEDPDRPENSRDPGQPDHRPSS